MARLIVDGFLSIKKADFVAKPLTILIGPQAQGKSVLAKLHHFFQWAVQLALIEIVSAELSLPELRRKALDKFVELFPRDTWTEGPFSVAYQDGEFSITVSRKGSRKNAALQMEFSRQLTQVVAELAAALKPRVKSAFAREPNVPQSFVRRRELTAFYKDRELVRIYLAYPLFIPASRSFFANIEKNIFSLISSKFELDPLMAEFGAALERARMFTQLGRRHAGPRDGIVTDWSEIIHGDYLFDGKDEFILSDKRRIRIANSSSGQQEVIPLLLMLRHSDAVARNPASGISYSIEEPEAHLFPSAQKAVAFRLARELNESVFNRVLVTTHSPYILTAFNNLILAGKLLEAGLSRESIKEVLPPECCVSPSAVAAYKVIDGQVIPIIDSATKLVNSYLIDEISSEFASEFNQLLDMQHQASK